MIDQQNVSARLASDLEGSFEELVRTFQDRLYGFTLRLTGSSRDAEESTQDTFVRAYRALQQYSPERRAELQVRPWLYRIALNVVRNRVRKAVVPEVVLDEPVQDHLANAPEERPEDQLLAVERQQRLARAIVQLPARYAAAVVLRHVQGLSYDEAAAVLGQPIGTTKSDVHRGLRLLRQALEPELLLEAAGSY